MAEVPKIVRERLRRASPGIHPDADTLAAFAERVLPERERGTILEHLASCRGCREILAVAAPVPEPAQTAVRSWPRPWLTWPALRWGFATAGIAVVASLGVVEHQRHVHPSMALYKASVPSEQKNAADSVAAPAPPLQDSKKQSEKTKDRALLTTARVAANKSRLRDEVAQGAIPAQAPQTLYSYSATPASKLRGAIGGPMSGPRANFQMNQANQLQQNVNAFNATAQAAPAAAPTANLPTNGRSVHQLDQIQAEPVQTAELSVQSQSLSQQSPQGGTDEAKVDRAKPLETVVMGSSKAYVAITPEARLARSASAGGARWTINPTGGLQRSLDQGATWQDVNVNASPAASGMTLVANERTDRLESSAKAEKQAPPIVFRAVAANGADVWAGGANGVLYHSTDGGNRWTRVVPSSKDVILTGDVVSVSFADALHGRIATSTSEAWVTGDGGQSWEKK